MVRASGDLALDRALQLGTRLEGWAAASGDGHRLTRAGIATLATGTLDDLK
jgi:hypothetical protein